MRWRFVHRVLLYFAGAACLTCLLLAGTGCGPGEPQLSEAAKNFKKEVLERFASLAPPMVQPAANRNVEAMTKVLAAGFEKAEKSGRPLPFRAVILDPQGFMLAYYPLDVRPAIRFSDYQGVKEVIKKRRISSGVLYFADGSQAYIVLAPLLLNENLVGMICLAIKADAAQEKWHLTRKDFQDINFNL